MKILQVGWWCLRCGDLLPEQRLCSCLSITERLDQIEAHKKKHWLPAKVEIPKYTEIPPI